MDRIQTIIESRKLTGDIMAEALKGVEGISEAGMRDRILANISQYPQFYPTGWYDPPAGGIGVLAAEAPYDRLKFETLRKPESAPQESVPMTAESVSILYASTVDKATGMIGDLGCTVYRGTDEKVREHISNTYKMIYDAAALAEVGMSFRELFAAAMQHFASQWRVIGWMTTNHDPLKTNLGHTVPGSYGEPISFGNSFEEVRETIRSKRVYINELETFKIPESCAFTFEARLMNPEMPELPNVFVHLMVTFSNGEKKILSNFDGIFKAAGMDYIKSNYG
ncbi:MAG: M24 family metallopeptidase [Candidatus Liptonbacteria bacterium]|nr:M24 family metallopeptidase [Candidatus Liptonbacteria bacterium]